MSRIILIDDNAQNQRIAYGASFVDDEVYSDILCHIERLNESDDLSFLKDAECVLIHDTLEDFIDGQFKKDSHYAKDMISELLEDNGIPHVYFSDGHESRGTFDDSGINLVQIKKSDFYCRLQSFLEYYRSENKPEFKILAYGNNYLKELLIPLIKTLNSKLASKRPMEKLTFYDLQKDDLDCLAEIVELSQPALGKDYENIISLIEDEELSVAEFRSHLRDISESTSRNGKNTYTWK